MKGAAICPLDVAYHLGADEQLAENLAYDIGDVDGAVLLRFYDARNDATIWQWRCRGVLREWLRDASVDIFGEITPSLRAAVADYLDSA